MYCHRISDAEAAKDVTRNAINEAHEVRLLCRHNLITDTIGKSGHHLQANLVVLPSKYADDFRNLCARNPVPCPILGWTEPGDPKTVFPRGCIQTLDFDVRTDLPRYRVHRGGQVVATKTDILDEWTDDHVAFLLGCSFSFEGAIKMAGLSICHERDRKRPAMYKTNIPVLPAGVFYGATMVVSMRLFSEAAVEIVRDVSRPFLATHGEPIAWGWEAIQNLGIRDFDDPDFGDKQTVREGEVPVFWVSQRRANGVCFSNDRLTLCPWPLHPCIS